MMFLILLLGGVIDFFEIANIIIPIIAPILIKLSINPLWFGILLQASFYHRLLVSRDFISSASRHQQSAPPIFTAALFQLYE
jgi:TRAP-type mannitol/chloroaromatic compound transport system permease large subunit